MRQQNYQLIEKTQTKAFLWRLSLSGNDVPSSDIGQFYLLATQTAGTYLRRAIFPVRVTIGDTAMLQFSISGAQLSDLGLAQLVTRPIGDHINLLGPLGQGFRIPDHAQNFLLLAKDSHLDLMLNLANILSARGKNVALGLECLNQKHLPNLAALAPSVEIIVATLDGSFGHRGDIFRNLGDLANWADHLMAIGTDGFYRQLNSHLREKRVALTPDFAQVVALDAPIHLCGTGACQRCTIATRHGLKLVCVDGPVFNLNDLSLSK